MLEEIIEQLFVVVLGIILARRIRYITETNKCIMHEEQSDNSSSTISGITAFNPSTINTPERSTTEETLSGSSESNTPSTLVQVREEVESSTQLDSNRPVTPVQPEPVLQTQETTIVLEQTKTTVVEKTSPVRTTPVPNLEIRGGNTPDLEGEGSQTKKVSKKDKKKNRNLPRVFTANSIKNSWRGQNNRTLTIHTPASQEEIRARDLELEQTLARNRANARRNRLMDQLDSEYYAQNSTLNCKQYIKMLQSTGADGESLDARVKLAVEYSKNNKLTPPTGYPRDTVSAVKPLLTPLTLPPLLNDQEVIDPLSVANTMVQDAERLMQLGTQHEEEDEFLDFPFAEEQVNTPVVSEVLNETHPPQPLFNQSTVGGLENYNLEYHVPSSTPNTGAIKKTAPPPVSIRQEEPKNVETITSTHINVIVEAINELTNVTNDLVASVTSSELQHKEYVDILSRHTVAIEGLGSKVQLVQDEMAGVRQAISSLERRFEEHLKLGQVQASRSTAPSISAHPAISNPAPALKPIPPRFEEMLMWFLEKTGLPITFKGVLGSLLSFQNVQDIRELAHKTGLPITESDIQFLVGFELRDRQHEKIKIMLGMITRWKQGIKASTTPQQAPPRVPVPSTGYVNSGLSQQPNAPLSRHNRKM